MSRSYKPSSRHGRSPARITAVLALSGTVVALMHTLVVPLLPVFPAIFGVTTEDASWLVTATLLSSAVATPIVSRCADMYGKRKMMVVCLVILVAGSVLAAIGGSFLCVVIGRALQGVSAALVPVGISIMRDELPKEKLGSAVALMSGTVGIGSAMGLPLAGIVYEWLGWTSIFWVSAAAGASLLVALTLVVPESALRSRGAFDFVGALLLSLVLVAFLLAVTKGGAWGWGSGPVLLLFLGATILLVAWVPFELKVARPMVDLRTFARPSVLMTNLASLLIGFSMFANMLLTTQQLQLPALTGYGFELSVISAGMCMVPSGLAMVVVAPLSGIIIKAFGGKWALTAGALVMIAGYVARVFFYDTVVSVIVGSTVIGVGTAVALAAMPTLIMGAVPVTETASANGLNNLARALGTATSSATIAAVFSSLTLSVNGAHLPSLDALKDMFWFAALACAASMLAAVFIPRSSARESQRSSGARTEVVVQGHVVAPDNSPLTPAMISVLQVDGEPVDWGRVDAEGNYSLALPGAGRYLIVVSAAGWAPVSEVFEFDGHTLQQSFVLRDRLEVKGLVSDDAGRVCGALVVLLDANGGHVASTRTDSSGRYAFPLPAAGRYVVAMLHPVSQGSLANKITVGIQSVALDFAAPSLEGDQWQAASASPLH